MGKLRWPGEGKDLPNHLQLQNQTRDAFTPIPALGMVSSNASTWRKNCSGSGGQNPFHQDRKLGQSCSKRVCFTKESSQDRPGLLQWWFRWSHGINSFAICWNSFIHSCVHMTTFYGAQSWESITCFTKAVSLAHIFWKDLLAVIKRHTKQQGQVLLYSTGNYIQYLVL